MYKSLKKISFPNGETNYSVRNFFFLLKGLFGMIFYRGMTDFRGECGLGLTVEVLP
jgi:hypothetical protein